VGRWFADRYLALKGIRWLGLALAYARLSSSPAGGGGIGIYMMITLRVSRLKRGQTEN